MHLIQEIGSYAGLAAVVGLALLSALLFSQARDVKRLREWAAEQRPQGGVPSAGAAPQRPPTGAPSAPAPAAPRPAAAGGDGTATPGAPPAAPSAGATPAAPAPAVAAAGVPAAAQAVAAGAGASSSAATDATEVRPPQAPPAVPPRVPPAPFLSPPGAAADRPPWYRRLGAARAITLVAVLLAIAAGAAVAATRLTSSASAPPPAAHPPGTASAPSPASITFAVLNGTTVAGLAKVVADKLEAAGYRRGNVTNATGQQPKAESVVLYAPGAHRAALAVARKLRIGQTERIDSRSRGLAGDAEVVVVVGNDQISRH